MKEYDRAKKLKENVLTIRRNAFGERHMDTASAYASLGNTVKSINLSLAKILKKILRVNVMFRKSNLN